MRACPDCVINAQVGCESVILSWVTAGEYQIYRSILGPNSGFALVATITGASFEDTDVTEGTTYFYRLKGANACMSAAVSMTYVYDANQCELQMCIDDLTAIAKSRVAELKWTCQPDAQCYNVYRSTSPDVANTAGNLIADCHTTAFCAYTDRSVTNGTTYYYKVTNVVNGAETCISGEVSATPVATTRTR